MNSNQTKSRQKDWHFDSWSALAWLETILKTVAIITAIISLYYAVTTGAFFIPTGKNLFQAAILLVLSFGLLVAVFDRIQRREIISMAFIVVNNIGEKEKKQ